MSLDALALHVLVLLGAALVHGWDLLPSMMQLVVRLHAVLPDEGALGASLTLHGRVGAAARVAPPPILLLK